MNPEIEKEKLLVIKEWEQRAKDDLESAQVLLKETDNYEIAVYHAHQAIEKYLKAKILKNRENFNFIHDLVVLFKQAYKGEKAGLLEKVAYVHSLYPVLRYPGGDKVTELQASKCLKIAREILDGK